MFLLGLLLLCISNQAGIASTYQIHYVKTSDASMCPNGQHIVQCQTLIWYSINLNGSFTSNTVMLFQEGTHKMNKFIRISNLHNFTMAGNGSASHQYVYGSNRLPNPTSTIKCTGESENAGIFFWNSSKINMINLKIEFCSGLYSLREHNASAGALVFNFVIDVSINEVVVSNAKGYGLHANNIRGTNKVHNSAFLNATARPNVSDSGNAMFYFSQELHTTNTALAIESSWFMYGETNYFYGAAGGLNVFIFTPGVRVMISDITCQGSIGINGGNLALFLVAFSVNASSITVDNSHILDGRATKGGGLRFWSHHKPIEEGSVTHDIHHILQITNTHFHVNNVRQTGGAIYMAFYNNNTITSFDGILRQVTIRNCTFTQNVGNGAAMEIIQHSLSDHHMTPMFQTSIESSTFTNNYVPLNIDGPILDFISVEVSVTNCTFSSSNSSSISLRNTYLNLYGDIQFENNTARAGGALKVCEASLMYVHTGAHVRFIENSAQKGGAIYVQQPCMDISTLCFIQPSVPQDMPIVEFTKLMKFEFINNSAVVAGDALYGGDVEVCSTVVPYYLSNSSERHNRYWYSKKIFAEIFDLQNQVGPSRISSDPRMVCFCIESQQFRDQSCIVDSHEVEVYPGEEFTVSVITVGQMNGSTSGSIITKLKDDDSQSHVLVRLSHPEPSAKCVILKFALNSNRSKAEISFKPVTSEIASHYRSTTLNLTVHLRICPLGFQLTATPPYKCICSPALARYLLDSSQTVCNINNQTISVPERRMWFGCLDPQWLRNQSSTCNKFAVTPNCEYYCRDADVINSRVVAVSVVDIDSQCLPGHTGVMCGGCKSGYSRLLGEAFECKKDCDSSNIPYILLASLIIGVLVFVIIISLNLTVTKGTLNGLLVYTMVIQTHRSYFPEKLSPFGQFCWVFISWINFTFGFKVCFYKGMDSYEQTWIYFANVFYVIFILVLIILLSRKFVFFTRLLGRNVIKVLATLAFLLYSNLLYASVVTFRFATLHVFTTNGSQHYSKHVWYYDGNVPYLGLKHSLLSIVASICAMVMFFFLVSLLFIQCLQKRSNVWCLRWVEKWRPFYEAYTGPCNDSYRFWPGFLLFMRTGIYIIDSLIPAWSDILFRVKMLITAAIFVVIMSMSCIFPHGVYKRWPLNILEFSFFLNLCITSGFLGFNFNHHRNVSIVYTSVSITVLTFAGILVYHLYCQIKHTTGWKKLMLWCSVQHQRVRMRHERLTDNEEVNTDDEATSLLPSTMPSVITFEDSEEPIVDA